MLDDLGVLEDFLAAGGPYPPLAIHLPDGESMEQRMDEVHEPSPTVPYPNTLMVPQWRTGELLAQGVPVEYGVGVETLRQDADGGRSTVRHALGVPFEGETQEAEQLFIADVRVAGLDRASWHVWPGADGRSMRLGLCPLAGTDQFQLVSVVMDASPQDLLADVDPSLDVQDVGWSSRWRSNVRLAQRFRVGNVFLAGDAAHEHPPTGGQGLNTGVQDAYDLGWKLATGDDEVLESYEAGRLPVAAAVLGISSALYQRAVDQHEDALRRDDPELQQLQLNYRGGPLAFEHRADPGSLRAGDRAPDFPPAETRIFGLLRGPHSTLLAVDWTDEPPDLGVPAYRIDEARDVYDGAGPWLFLVRPDNHVGCVATDPADVVRYLNSVREGREHRDGLELPVCP